MGNGRSPHAVGKNFSGLLVALQPCSGEVEADKIESGGDARRDGLRGNRAAAACFEMHIRVPKA
jgi:hypothetical protein